jgi:hypothetical protein
MCNSTRPGPKNAAAHESVDPKGKKIAESLEDYARSSYRIPIFFLKFARIPWRRSPAVHSHLNKSMHLTDPINSQFLISLGLPNMLIFLID